MDKSTIKEPERKSVLQRAPKSQSEVKQKKRVSEKSDSSVTQVSKSAEKKPGLYR